MKTTKNKIKTPAFSETIKTEVVCPNDTNPMGILQGGKLVQWMDIAAAVCAQTHAGKICVTVSIDQVSFKHAARVGDIIMIKAKVTRAFTSSMEIFVEAWSRTVMNNKNDLINEAFFTFVALDENAKPSPVPSLRPITKREKELYAGALKRKKNKV